MLGVRCLGTAVIFQTCISSAKLARGYPGNMPNLYFSFCKSILIFVGTHASATDSRFFVECYPREPKWLVYLNSLTLDSTMNGYFFLLPFLY